MSKLLDGLGDELKRHGVKVKYVKGWKTRTVGGTFSPRGVMFHHTASNRAAGNAPSLGIVTHGRSDLDGPLSNFVVGRDGTVYFVAAGRCNHAGAGGPKLDIPKDSGNAYLFGIECENDGLGEKWPDHQLKAIAILSGCLLKRVGKGKKYLIAHKEWTSRKIDPANVSMTKFRLRVAALRAKFHP